MARARTTVELAQLRTADRAQILVNAPLSDFRKMLPQETTALLLAALTIILQDSFQANGQSAALIQRRISALGSPRPFGSDRPSRAEEFNRTGVLHPEYLITATLKPTNVSQ